VRLSAIQFAAATDVATNLSTIGELVSRAADEGVEVAVLPEGSMHDFGPPDLPLGPVAQPLDGEFVSSLGQLAARHGITIVAGMFECSDDPDRPFNTLVVLDPAGQVVSSYRKTHLYDSFGYRESDRLLSGSTTPVTVSVGDLTVGLMTCYDLRFPEFARALVEEGSDVLVVPSAWVRGPLKEAHWAILLQARAIENTVYVVGAAQTGDHYTGCSRIVDPMGVTVAALGDEQGLASAAVVPQRVAEVRERNPSLANRRLGRESSHSDSARL
jgi:predicted amidohydrolase